jgi:hypothetical protein
MGRIVFIAYFLTSLSFLAIVGKVKAQSKVSKAKEISQYRFGASIGNSFLTTKGMDFLITTDVEEFYELQPTANLSLYRLLNQSTSEFGLVFRHGEMKTLLRNSKFAVKCIFDELQFSYQKSLNSNARLKQGRLTYNLVFSLGLINFKSKYSANLDDSIKMRTISSVGYPRTDWDVYQLKRQNSFVGSIGFAIGCRITKHFSLYWENSFNLVTTTKMKGSLFPDRGGFADGYLFSGVGVYLRLQPPLNKLRCPRIR